MSSFLSNITQNIPVPKIMAFEHAGVDIGMNHIRHVSFSKIGTKISIKNFGIYEIPPVQRDVMLSDQDGVILALKKMQKEFSYKYVEVSLPEDLVYIYTSEVDGNDKESMRTQAEFKLEENVPLKIDDAVFDITPIIYLKDVNKTLISIAVVSKKITNDYISLFRKASMEVVSFLVQNQALSKTLIPKADIEPYCIVAIEKRNIVVSIVTSGIVLYTSTIGQSAFKDGVFIQDLGILNDLVKDVNKIIIFWLSYIEKNPTFGFKPLKAILLSSTHIDILESNFAHMLTSELSIPVRLADVWANISIAKNEVPEIHKKDSYQYATAIGLAMPKI